MGTIFGGSLYGAIDPFYMLMLIKILGPEYIVWDKAATIQFKRPGKGTLVARFVIDKNDPEEIRKLLQTEHSINRTYQVDLTDSDGIVCASFEKMIYIRRKNVLSKTSSLDNS